jgi:HD domain-containing protein
VNDASHTGDPVDGFPVWLTEIPQLGELLAQHTAVMGRDAVPYGNHAYRVANLCIAFASRDPDTVHKVAIAAALHDMGIWTNQTFDYLPPSIELARTHLERIGRAEWIAEITTMILEHHKISPYRGRADWLVESFRKSDWIDVTWGLLSFGVPRTRLQELQRQWPDAGFHMGLVKQELRQLRTHPLNPLPMFRA